MIKKIKLEVKRNQPVTPEEILRRDVRERERESSDSQGQGQGQREGQGQGQREGEGEKKLGDIVGCVPLNVMAGGRVGERKERLTEEERKVKMIGGDDRDTDSGTNKETKKEMKKEKDIEKETEKKTAREREKKTERERETERETERERERESGIGIESGSETGKRSRKTSADVTPRLRDDRHVNVRQFIFFHAYFVMLCCVVLYHVTLCHVLFFV